MYSFTEVSLATVIAGIDGPDSGFESPRRSLSPGPSSALPIPTSSGSQATHAPHTTVAAAEDRIENDSDTHSDTGELKVMSESDVRAILKRMRKQGYVSVVDALSGRGKSRA